MTRYFAELQQDGAGWLVTFPDVPEAVSGGATEVEAVGNARDALEVTLLTYALDGRSLPPVLHKSAVEVIAAADVAIKIAFMEAFRASGLTRVALAHQLGKQEGEVRRMLDPYHATKLATMETGLRALGKTLVVSVRNAA